MISGCHIHFVETPPLTGLHIPPPLSADQLTVLSSEIFELETKESIYQLPPNNITPGFHSPKRRGLETSNKLEKAHSGPSLQNGEYQSSEGSTHPRRLPSKSGS